MQASEDTVLTIPCLPFASEAIEYGQYCWMFNSYLPIHFYNSRYDLVNCYGTTRIQHNMTGRAQIRNKWLHIRRFVRVF